MAETKVTAGPIPTDALEYFRSKRLRTSWDHSDWGKEHNVAFTVAKAMLVEVLRNIHDELDRALEQGLTLQEFKRNLGPILQKKGWWGRIPMTAPDGQVKEVQAGSPRRLKVIYDTNMRVSRAAGQWARIQRTGAVRPYLLYSLGPSERHRPAHVAWAGTLLPHDDPAWERMFPPNGWGCKCRVRQIGHAEAERLGGPTEAPKFDADKPVPGIDKGWDYNPGAAPRSRPFADRNETDALAQQLRARLNLGEGTGVVRARAHEANKHQFSGALAQKHLQQGRPVFAFSEGLDLDELASTVLKDGVALGQDVPAIPATGAPVTGAKFFRFVYDFQRPVGLWMQVDRATGEVRQKAITQAEVKARKANVDGSWEYHLIPRVGANTQPTGEAT